MTNTNSEWLWHVLSLKRLRARSDAPCLFVLIRVDSWLNEKQIGASVCCHYRHRELLRRSEEHTSELQSQSNLVCRLLLEKKKCYQLDVDLRSIFSALHYSSAGFVSRRY